MTRQIVLLRGINVGRRNRVAMAELRELLSAAGFDEVATYLQSGNAVVSSDSPPARVAKTCREQIAEQLGLEIEVVVRTRDELAEVVQRDPLGEVAVDPKRYQVSFLDTEPDSEVESRLAAVAAPGERFAVIGREIYAWHPKGVGGSKLWTLLAGRALGVTATARNWTTVTKLLALADE